MRGKQIVVIGAGIGGLTAGALLARRGYSVQVFDQAIVPGGCASTFQRQGFTFDVGATQVAGLEPGGIHHRIFEELEVEVPQATYCDPACAVFLPGESVPINLWRSRLKWEAERKRQFPGSEGFWQLMAALFRASWQFQGRDPVLPPRNLWDLWQLGTAVRLDTLITVPFTLMTVGDALRLCGVGGHKRLRQFLNLQLKLYSQVDADETALLYGATALAVSQEPQGLFHLQGSMQVLSDRLVEALTKYGGKLWMGHRVEKILTESGRVTAVRLRSLQKGKVKKGKGEEVWTVVADEVVGNVTVQNLVNMLEPQPLRMSRYQGRVDKLPAASGAFVVYIGVDRTAIPAGCPPHLQFLYDEEGPIGENNSLFVSVSKEGDGRAPLGQRTIIASSFTDTGIWWGGTKEDYEQLKQKYMKEAIARLAEYFHLSSETIIYQEAATPRTFARFTARERGIVGGIGQRVSTFGPFGFATRTPLSGLWLVGDSTHPGEGTAGVSYSALTAVRQIENQ